MDRPPAKPLRASHRRTRAEKAESDAVAASAMSATRQARASDARAALKPAPTSDTSVVNVSLTTRRKAPKPNRQRCKEFRERRKNYSSELEERVGTLRKEVSELVIKKSIYSSKVMLKRHHAHGSLDKLVREYFALFRYGIAVDRPLPGASELQQAVSPRSRAKVQWDFLHRVIDEDTVYADHRGPSAAIAQWNYYTAAYASFVGEVSRVNIAGPEDDPILYCYTTYHVILSRNTFKYLFPHAIHNEDLVQRFIGLYVPCPVVAIFRFTPEGLIASETANIELGEALLFAGCRVEDVAEIMSGFVVSESGAVPDRLQAEDSRTIQELEAELDAAPVKKEPGVEKLSISYLLDASDETEEKENDMSRRN